MGFPLDSGRTGVAVGSSEVGICRRHLALLRIRRYSSLSYLGSPSVRELPTIGDDAVGRLLRHRKGACFTLVLLGRIAGEGTGALKGYGGQCMLYKMARVGGWMAPCVLDSWMAGEICI